MTDQRSDSSMKTGSRASVEALNKTIAALEARLDGMVRNRQARSDVAPPSQPAAADIRSEAAQPDTAAGDAPIRAGAGNAALAEIFERQKRLAEERRAAASSEAAPKAPPAQPAMAAAVPPLPAIASSSDAGDSDLRDVAQALVALRRELRSELTRDISDGVGRQVAALRDDLAGMRTAGGETDMTRGLRDDLDRLTRTIDRLDNRQDAFGADGLRSDIAALRGLIDEIGGAGFSGLADRLDAVGMHVAGIEPTLQAEISGLNARLSDLRGQIDMLPAAEVANRLEARVLALTQTIDGLVGANDEDDAALSREFAAINDRLDEITRAVAVSKTPSVDAAAIERLERGLADLGNQISQSLAQTERDDSGLTERIELLANNMEQLVARDDIDRLAGKLDSLSDAFGASVPANAFHDIAGYLEDLSAKIEGLDRRLDDARDNAPLVQRLDALAERMEGLAAVDAAGGTGGVAPALPLLQRLEALMERAEERERNQPEFEGLEGLQARLDDLSARMGDHQAGPSDAALQGLEMQIASLSKLMVGPTDGMRVAESVEPRLAAIEGQMARAQDDLIEAASQAAQAAVTAFLERGMNDFDGGSDELDAVAALAEDLRALEKLTRASDERNARTFDAIHDTLIKIAERLEHLDMRREAQRVAVAAADTIAAQRQDAPVSSAVSSSDDAGSAAKDDHLPAPAIAAAMTMPAIAGAPPSLLSRITQRVRPARTDAARADTARIEPDAGDVTVADDRALVEPTPSIDPSQPAEIDVANQPLEPGSGAPDINRILQKVREQQIAGGRVAGDEASQADFIAAARRAAQAAAAEVEHTSRGKDNAAGGAAPNATSRRRPILMATGAVLLALMSYPLVTAMMTGNDNAAPVAEVEAPVTAPVAEAPLAPADTAAMPEASQLAGTASPLDDGMTSATSPQASALDRSSSPSSTDASASTGNQDIVSAPTDIAASSDAGPAVTEPQFDPETDIESTAPREDIVASVDALPQDFLTLALREAAREGDPLALFEVGARYTEGRGTDVDLATAANWYRLSAEEGFAPAQYRLGNLYEKGTGLTRDLEQARLWYGRSADQGNASAMHNLAVLDAMGAEGQAPDYDTAATWFARAAELGVRDSQFNLAILYARGSGVPQDLGQSYKWFAIAAREGDQDAAAKRDEVANAMETEALDRARAEVELWQPQPLDAEANSTEIPESWGTAPLQTASIDMTQAVRNIQAILNKNGFDAGQPDGVMGQRTVAAIKSFQESAGMAATGEIDDALVRALLERNG
jgi:localization factor PodJL